MALLLNAGDTVSRSYSYTQPSPLHPSQPQGTGERTENLVRFYQEEMQRNFYGVDVTVKNAEITLNGTTAPGSGHWVEIGYKFGEGTESTDNVIVPCEPETPYTIAIEILDGNSSQVRVIAFGTSVENRIVNIGSSLTTTFSDDINRIFISLGAGGVVFNNLKFRVMFNKGSTPLPYKPYGYKIPILSASTTTPVYLGEVESTRRIKKLVLTGNEDITATTGNAPFVLPLLDIIQVNNRQIILFACSHYEAVSNSASWSQYNSCVSWSFSGGINAKSLVFRDTSCADVDAFKTYLAAQYVAGTPVTVWYVLAEPTTGIVNEPLMKIGEYADEIINISVPTIIGTNTFNIDTVVQPSEVTLNYHGWHPIDNTHEHDNGEWN